MGNIAMTIRFAAIAFVAVLVSGCGTGQWIDSHGVPHERYLVGGGTRVQFRAVEDGVAYLVEGNTRKVIATQSLAEGETFDQVWVMEGLDEFEQKVGVPMREARLLLYFVPAADTRAAPQP